MPSTEARTPKSSGCTLLGIWAVPSCLRICDPIGWSYFLTYASIDAWSPAGVAAWAVVANPVTDNSAETVMTALRTLRLPRHEPFMGCPFRIALADGGSRAGAARTQIVVALYRFVTLLSELSTTGLVTVSFHIALRRSRKACGRNTRLAGVTSENVCSRPWTVSVPARILTRAMLRGVASELCRKV